MSETDDVPKPESGSAAGSVGSTAENPAGFTRSPQLEAGPILTIGWREWISLPMLGLPAVKVKVDTGARTSAIHAFDIERFKRGVQDWVRFNVHPLQRDTSVTRQCEAPLVDIRQVTDSGGHTAERYFISTELQLGHLTRNIEITLTQRNDMLFRMLLGRTAMVPGIQVDPSKSFLMGRVSARALYTPE